MRRALALFPFLLTPLAPAQLRSDTPRPLLTAHTLALRNAPGASALPAPAFEHLAQSFRQWRRYRLLPSPRHADLVTTVSQTPGHQLHLRILSQATGVAVWDRTVDLDPSQDPVANLDTSLDFLMLRLRNAVDHPLPDPDQSVP